MDVWQILCDYACPRAQIHCAHHVSMCRQRRFGIRDRTRAALSERLVEIGVSPYYLHLLDRVTGAAHYDVPVERAEALHRRLRDMLPGYAVPRLAREVPGEPATVWIA